ncbi:uncharacterized protein LOC131991624 [Centropristis striata]|uniref:uncharacterized protein LOC131991624 n=1 Tax=Centropristis striata TaxID=184440 RepID=UPI0027E0E893|nr:uncharacterized protein LOC131991624 [Centropristis striata]XP_059213085.1 uncharacterized protein LOC131991624 [Centropristis striata]
MATLKKVDHTAVNGSDKELPAQEEAVSEQTPERRHADALLDISEEDLMQELEPHEYHCYSGWEEAVHGWARVAPLSCILLTQKRYKKPKHKETDNLTALSVDPTISDADSSASTSEHCCESRVGLNNSLKTSMLLNQHAGIWSNPAVGALQKDASEWPVLNAIQKTMSDLVLKDKIKKEEGLRETPSQPHQLPSKYSENRSTKHQKHRQRPNNAVVPIKNFTFLPPITSQFCSGIKAPAGETIEEDDFMFDKKSGTRRTRGTRVEPIDNPELHSYSAALTSKYRTCQQNPHVFSAVSVSVPKRYQVPMSSRLDTVHCTSYLVGKSLTQALHSDTVAGAQAHMHPSKTVCM